MPHLDPLNSSTLAVHQFLSANEISLSLVSIADTSWPNYGYFQNAQHDYCTVMVNSYEPKFLKGPNMGYKKCNVAQKLQHTCNSTCM